MEARFVQALCSVSARKALVSTMQRAPAAAAAAAASRSFSVSIPSLPLPPTPPASKWLPIHPPSQSAPQSKPLWLERPNGAPLPFLSNSLEKVVLAGTKPQLIDKMTTEEGKAYPDRFSRAHLWRLRSQ